MLLEMNHITKVYGPVAANDDVSIQLDAGEVLAVVGENGAGKTTLMKILYGLQQPDRGEICLKGQPVSFKNPREAMAHGIGMVQQHFMLFPSMTITENIVYNHEMRRGIFYDKRKNREKVTELSELYGLYVDPDAVVKDCPVGTQQRVEILKTLYQNADIIIFDEPSAVLTPPEVEELLKTIRKLSALGKSIILITHKLEEVMNVSSRVIVMRDGKLVAEKKTADTSVEELSWFATGRHLVTPEIPENETRAGLLEVKGLTLASEYGTTLLRQIDMHVDYGEIVGVAGVSGNGQSELVRAVTGLITGYSGSIRLKGKEMSGANVAEFRRNGMAHIPEDRYEWGSAAQATLADNALMGKQRDSDMGRSGILNLRRVNQYGEQLIGEYDVKAAGVHQKMRELSGGNAQKLIFAREASHNTSFLVASEPTRGVDVGAMEFIHNKLLEKRARGDGVLLVSSELSEIMKLSDRIYVMYEGEIRGEFRRGQVDERQLGLLMTGGKTDES